MAHLDERDVITLIGDEKRADRQSITSTTYSLDRTTLFSDDATIRAATPPSFTQSPNVHKRRTSTSVRMVPNAFALSRSCSRVNVVEPNHSSIMGAITSFTISRTARFLNFLGLKSTCISERNVVREWMRELDELLSSPPEKLWENQEKLSQTLDDLLTLTSTEAEKKGKASEREIREREHLQSLLLRTCDSDWIKGVTKFGYNSGRHGCTVVIMDYLCRLYRTQDVEGILQQILLGILECGMMLLALSPSLAPKLLRDNALTVFCDAVSQRQELFAVDGTVALYRDCLLLRLTSILHSCDLTEDFVRICGEKRLARFIETVSGDEYCTRSKEFVIVSSLAVLAKYSQVVRQRLPEMASMPMFVSTLQISTLNVYGKAVSWDILLEIDDLLEKICEAAILLLRTLFNRSDLLWTKDDLFLGNVSRLIRNESFRKKFIEYGAVSSVLVSLEPLQGNLISLEAPSQPKRAVASLLMLLLRLDPEAMAALTDGWFKGLDIQDGKVAIGSFDLQVFCWATALFAVSVEFYPELAVYPDSKDAIKRLVDGCRACTSPWGKEKYTLALEQCWESIYGKPILKSMGLTEYDVLLGMR